MSLNRNSNDFIKRCEEHSFNPNEMLVMAIALNEINYVDQVLSLYDIKNKYFSNINHGNLVDNFSLFLNLVESKIPAHDNDDCVYINSHVLSQFGIDDRRDTDEAYWSHLAINTCNKDIIKCLYDKELFCETTYIICGDNMECFDNLLDMCANDKNLMFIALKSLYKGMKMVYNMENNHESIMIRTNGFENTIIEGLTYSRHSDDLVRKIFLFCKLKRWDFGIAMLLDHFKHILPDIHNISINRIVSDVVFYYFQ